MSALEGGGVVEGAFCPTMKRGLFILSHEWVCVFMCVCVCGGGGGGHPEVVLFVSTP